MNTGEFVIVIVLVGEFVALEIVVLVEVGNVIVGVIVSVAITGELVAV